MRLTSFTDYSLRVLIFLAAEPGRRATIAEVAQAFDVSENHLTKVVHFLGKGGWIDTVRGQGGGISLKLDTERIVVGAVVRAAEGPPVPAECFSNHPDGCRIHRSCRLKPVLKEATDAFYAVLDRYTLADLVRNGPALAKILHLHR